MKCIDYFKENINYRITQTNIRFSGKKTSFMAQHTLRKDTDNRGCMYRSRPGGIQSMEVPWMDKLKKKEVFHPSK